MAITTADYLIWTRMDESGAIPPNPRILELGEANWYGDYPIDRWIDESIELADEIRGVCEARSEWYLFDLAKLFYRSFCDPTEIVSIDLHGTPAALQRDLNGDVLDGLGEFDVVLNNGTAEHVFDVARVLKTCHDACKPGGIMVHDFPLRGWLDHGFWAVNPTLLEDLAYVNDYELLQCCLLELDGRRIFWLAEPINDVHNLVKADQLGPNVLIYVAWRKASDEPFRAPRQGVYADRLSGSAMDDWKKMR